MKGILIGQEGQERQERQERQEGQEGQEGKTLSYCDVVADTRAARSRRFTSSMILA
jgi:hypothetical protein